MVLVVEGSIKTVCFRTTYVLRTILMNQATDKEWNWARDKDSGLDLERVKELYKYIPETGKLLWNKSGAGRNAGEAAGFKTRAGYRATRIGKLQIRVHRLVWFMMTGKWPVRQIDHINGIKDDNRWCNLREATDFQGQKNRSVHKNNKLGVKGVRMTRHGRYRVSIRTDHKLIYLGVYETLAEAKKVREEATMKYHGEFGRLE